MSPTTATTTRSRLRRRAGIAATAVAALGLGAAAAPAVAVPDLTVTSITPSVNPGYWSRTFSYTIVVRNIGTSVAAGPALDFSLPNSDRHDFSTTSGFCSPDADTCAFDPMPPGGEATVKVSVRPLKTGTITATATTRNTADANRANDSRSASSQIIPRPTRTSLTVSPLTTVYGQPVTFSSQVLDALQAGNVFGSVPVQFRVDGTTIATVSTGGSYRAQHTAARIAAGTHNARALFNGNVNLAASASPTVTFTVAKASTTSTAVTSANARVARPFAIYVTPRVVAPGSGTPTGTVTFRWTSGPEAGTVRTAQLNSGVASLVYTPFQRGQARVTATYSGSSDFNGSAVNLSYFVG